MELPLLGMLLVALIFILQNYLWAARVKDIARIGGAQIHQLIGYGVVVGLNGTGDSSDVLFTTQSVKNMLSNFGVNISPTNLKMKSVAAVIVTATLPPFVKKGSTIDVLVSSLGDATSLQGGTLLSTQLQMFDGRIIAFAQGPVSIGGFNVESAGGFSAKAGGESMSKNHPTVGRIPNGAIIQREYHTDIMQEATDAPEGLPQRQTLSIVLNRPDFTTAARLQSIINSSIADNIATAVDAAIVNVNIPTEETNLVNFISAIENLKIVPDTTATVVIDERTGTVVMGENVQISTVAVAHGNLSIRISTEGEISQPQPLSSGQTVVVPQTEVKVDESSEQLMVVKSGVDINEVVKALNAIGATPRDLISILQAIKEAGALQAELIIM
ncbi:MAG: flagellar basal body P-ring protein FlgI [Candidatus Poribacteria bacterium]